MESAAAIACLQDEPFALGVRLGVPGEDMPSGIVALTFGHLFEFVVCSRLRGCPEVRLLALAGRSAGWPVSGGQEASGCCRKWGISKYGVASSGDCTGESATGKQIFQPGASSHRAARRLAERHAGVGGDHALDGAKAEARTGV